MSKTHRKSHDEIEHLRGKIRELQKENNSLKRRLKSLEKWEHAFSEFDPDEQIEVKTEEVNECCPQCKTGKLTELDLNILKIISCNECDYSERKRNK